jgi:hypothetical protein
MKTTLLGVVILLGAVAASAQIEWRVSVKFILGSNGERPCCGNYDSFEDVTNRINEANAILRRQGRGYEYRLDQVTTVAGISEWFDRDREQAHALEVAAEAAPTTYRWRFDAINVYINNWNGTAICSFPHDPSGENDIIFLGQASFTTSFGHEAGHYFDLRHTFDGEQNRNSDNTACDQGCSCAKLIGGNRDLINDTIGDHECWNTQNAIAQGNYGVNYGAPGCDDAAVDRLYFNVMSYRTAVRDRLTEDQLDRMTDTSNDVRFNVTNGRTRFVDRNCGAISRNGSSECGPFSGPFAFVRDGVNSAQGGDIVLIRGGNYNEPMTINRSLTLRASRGTVTIGQ